MKQVVLLIVLGLLSISSGLGIYADAAGMQTHTLVHQGLTRTYHVYLPPGHSRSKAAPLVIALHGGGAKQPVGVLFMNGTQDPLVPFEGGQVMLPGRSRGKILSTEASVRWWVKNMGCNSSPKKSQLPNIVRTDGTRTEVEKYMDCRGRVQVILYRITGGGHTWPGGMQYLPKKVIGRVSRDFQGARKIFDFFAQHHR